MVNFFDFFLIKFFCFVVAIFDLVHDVELYMACVNIAVSQASYFRKDFQMLLAAKEGGI